MIKENGNGGPDPLIDLRRVVKIYKTPAGDLFTPKDINLQASPGGFVVVVGKGGAGKSTVIDIITGIGHPTSGEIAIGGTPVHSLKKDRLARRRGKNLGMVFQFFRLLPNLNPIENISQCIVRDESRTPLFFDCMSAAP